MDLPYPRDALEPYISTRTMSFHHGKHHAGYVEKTRKLLSGTPLAGRDLVDIIRTSAEDASRTDLFQNAAQVYNHDVFWRSMKPGGGGKPPEGDFSRALAARFGSCENFRKAFAQAAAGRFGSGWAWLAVAPDGELAVYNTMNADNPLIRGHQPLLALDVWEHAYYLDYQNRRGAFIEAYLDHLVNWDHAQSEFHATT
ncbi:MAG: superoxide dismutase [Deltaproteobacteria bacterium]|nr:superoxide dismutase [Deltaproteobacteria bacterium]